VPTKPLMDTSQRHSPPGYHRRSNALALGGQHRTLTAIRQKARSALVQLELKEHGFADLVGTRNSVTNPMTLPDPGGRFAEDNLI
jgi:hypothetical protein